MTYNITNTSKEGRCSCEVYFSGKPGEDVRDALKAERFRWHSVKKCWYGYKDAETVRAILEAANTGALPAVSAHVGKIAADTVKKANKYGVKVGDWFSMSWGYEQTNNTFFQVVALCGSESVRVREASPVLVGSSAVSGMSEHRTVNYPAEIQPARRSVFVDDIERGDIKRIKDFGDGHLSIQFKGHYFAKLQPAGATETVYESWYY